MRRLAWLGAGLCLALVAPPAFAAPPSIPQTPNTSLASLQPPAVAVPAAPARPKPRKLAHAIAASAVPSGPTVPGSVAQILPSGLAAAPASAPHSVKVMIWTANRLIGLRYRYGGGHASFSDTSYDCSGSVSYALHAAGMLASPEDSTGLESWGRRGTARWVTVYTNRAHAWMIVAGIRLDTSPVGDPSGLDGPRWRPASRPTAGFKIRHAGGEKAAAPVLAPSEPPTLPTPGVPGVGPSTPVGTNPAAGQLPEMGVGATDQGDGDGTDPGPSSGYGDPSDPGSGYEPGSSYSDPSDPGSGYGYPGHGYPGR